MDWVNRVVSRDEAVDEIQKLIGDLFVAGNIPRSWKSLKPARIEKI